IGWITKTVTATLLAAAVRDGRLALTDPVQNFAPAGLVLPAYSDWNGTVPIRFVDLATHTAALPADPGYVPAGGYTTEQMYGYLQSYALACAPGRLWNYSNLGFRPLANVLPSLGDLDRSAEAFAPWQH